ncbi:hypothetical protein GUY61_32200 [Streptomyces sp. GC420]|nr:hypothetical protein [Streptomyces sp. GC420]
MPRGHRGPLLLALAVLPFYGVWAAFLATGGGDLAAQYAWAGFAERNPGAPYGLFWYGGLHTAGYSVLSPPLMALLGVRTVTVVSGVAATWLLAALLERTGTKSPPWPALLGAFGLWANVASGRTTFALGLVFALAGLLVLAGRPVTCGRVAAAAAAGLLTTLASPVAGLFLVVAGAGYALDRQYAKGTALAVPPFAVCGLTSLLFPLKGEQPMAADRMIMPVLLAAAVCWAAPRGWRVVRAAAAVYALGTVLTWLVPSPIGTNVERLAEHFAPTVLLAAVIGTGFAAARRRPAVVLALALALSVHWLTGKTIDDLRISTDVPAWAEHTDGVIAQLERLGADRGRVEVVPARNHREAAAFAPHVAMMRGWNRQLDVERGRLFYEDTEGRLDGERYRAWLRHWAVGYVVLHNGTADGPAVREAALVRAGREWLEPVWQDAHWRIYRFTDARPLASAPAEVLDAGEADVVLRMPRAGTVTVRVAYSPWLRVNGACVKADGPWTRLTVPEAGVYRLHPELAPRRSAGCG